jgi:streptogramin lyase
LFVGGAQAQVITEFGSGITAGAGVYGITTGPDGNLWFTEFAGNRIGRLNPATGAVTEFSNGITAGAQPDDITAGPDGNLWFTERKGNRIGKINPATGVVTEYSVGISPNAGLSGIAAGPDGNLWFTEPYGNYRKIGKINPTTGVITEYTSGINSALLDVTAGPDGNLWFTQDLVNHIGKINPATALVTEYSSGVSAAADTWGIAAGPDGNLWFTEANDNQIGKINPTTGVITEYSNGITHGASPLWIAAGPDGNLWFTESSGNRIGRITPAGVVTEFSAGITAGAVLAHITAGPDGNLWFTENASDRIGRITVVLSPSSLENPQPDSFQSGIGLISGWSCQGPSITVSIDGHSPVPVSYGAPRIDTASVCGAGNTNTGFGLLLNFNTLGNGLHSAQLYVNGSARGNAVQFTGVAPAGEFLAGVSKQVAVQDFPTTGKTTALTWQQSQQNFAIAGVAAKALDSLSLETGTTASLENPQPGSFQSGIGLLSGWSCQGPTISMAIDGAPPLGVPYGSARIDTAGVCGAADTNTGFGLLINFNTLGAGTHSAQLLVNGAAQGSPIPFTVTVPAGEFLSGASKQVQVNDFPRTGATTTLTWQQAQQNFAIQAVGP